MAGQEVVAVNMVVAMDTVEAMTEEGNCDVLLMALVHSLENTKNPKTMNYYPTKTLNLLLVVPKNT